MAEMWKNILVRIFIALPFLGGTLAYSFGPPSEACSLMTPGHGATPDTTPAPYSITFSKSTYSANEQINVTLNGTRSFKGFLVQARPSKDTFTTYGTISVAAGTQNPCENGISALSHNSPNEKQSITFTWTAPSTYQGTIVFVYTVVQSQPKYWVKLTSSSLTYQPAATTASSNNGSGASQVPHQSSTTTTSTSSQSSGSSQGSTKKQPELSLKKDIGCGKTLGCFHDCSNTDTCSFLLTWAENGDNIDLYLTCQLGVGDVYCAIGLSSDDKMGDDSVFECVSSNNVVTASVSYNKGNSNLKLDNATFGLSGVTTAYSNGILSCKFSRKKTFASVGGTSVRKKREAPSAATYFDMNQDWTLFYAKGKSIAGFLTQHDTLPLISQEVADFQSTTDIGATKSSVRLLKAHGILMTLAWMIFATLGIFTARFYKTAASQGTMWCGQKPWFQTHRSCMVLTLFLTAAAFIIIFVHVKGYAEMEGESFDNFDKSHPIIGIIVMALVVINPVMALFRPHPGTPKRPVFNFAHTTVGVVAHALGIVNLFSGTRLIDALPSAVRIVLYVFVGWTIFIEVILHIYECKDKRKGKGSQYEMKAAGESNDSEKQTVGWFRLVVFVVHCLVLTGLGLYVLGSIGRF